MLLATNMPIWLMSRISSRPRRDVASKCFHCGISFPRSFDGAHRLGGPTVFPREEINARDWVTRFDQRAFPTQETRGAGHRQPNVSVLYFDKSLRDRRDFRMNHKPVPGNHSACHCNPLKTT